MTVFASVGFASVVACAMSAPPCDAPRSSWSRARAFLVDRCYRPLLNSKCRTERHGSAAACQVLERERGSSRRRREWSPAANAWDASGLACASRLAPARLTPRRRPRGRRRARPWSAAGRDSGRRRQMEPPPTDEVVQRETVVTRHEVDARLGLTLLVTVQRRAADQAVGEPLHRAFLTAEAAADVVAETPVPLLPAVSDEGADLVE